MLITSELNDTIKTFIPYKYDNSLQQKGSKYINQKMMANKLLYIRCAYYMKYAWKIVKSKITMLSKRSSFLSINHMSGWAHRELVKMQDYDMKSNFFYSIYFIIFTELIYWFNNYKEATIH